MAHDWQNKKSGTVDSRGFLSSLTEQKETAVNLCLAAKPAKVKIKLQTVQNSN